LENFELVHPKKVILWDVDGTLIKIDDNRLNKHQLAANILVAPKDESSKNYTGMTDKQILKRIIGPDFDILSITEKFEIFHRLNKLTKEELVYYPVTVNSYVEETLQKANQLGWQNAILTGNTLDRARSKLESAKLLSYFPIELIFNGETLENRNDLVKFSNIKLLEMGFHKIILVGDTPNDIFSAQSANLPIISVSTGKFIKKQLETHVPDLHIDNLLDGSDAFFEFLRSI
jgi:phosphoglycolate phosphatase